VIYEKFNENCMLPQLYSAKVEEKKSKRKNLITFQDISHSSCQKKKITPDHKKGGIIAKLLKNCKYS